MDREQVVALQHQRFAAKKYDPNRRISQKDWEALVEVGRLAPSSIGLEPWKMLLLKNERMKEDLKPMAWGVLFGLCSEPFCHLSCAKRRYL
ncbi:nitroreductase family protein [Helicobacter pylori]|nr:nitroreductase family protein [Helicobacter pylori]